MLWYNITQWNTLPRCKHTCTLGLVTRSDAHRLSAREALPHCCLPAAAQRACLQPQPLPLQFTSADAPVAHTHPPNHRAEEAPGLTSTACPPTQIIEVYEGRQRWCGGGSGSGGKRGSAPSGGRASEPIARQAREHRVPFNIERWQALEHGTRADRDKFLPCAHTGAAERKQLRNSHVHIFPPPRAPRKYLGSAARPHERVKPWDPAWR